MEKVDLLLVDDNPSGFLTMEAVLTCPEYNLVKAGSGQEAISRILDHSFAVILMDVQMPGMDGFETARVMKQHHASRDTPIIFITAINKEGEHIFEGYKSGAVDYIFKPFDPYILRCKVGIFVELYRKNLEVQSQAKKLSAVNQALEIEVMERKRAQQEIIEVSSAERQRIGQDLHDSIAQQMAAICLMSNVLWKKLVEKSFAEAEKAFEIHELSKKAIEETKNLARGFYPIELERQGFFPAVEEFLVNLERIFSVRCTYKLDTTAQIEDFETATHLYRIIQEAIYNAIKHGRAKQVWVQIEKTGGEVLLTIKDDGVGISTSQPAAHDGMGLRIMNYRSKIIGAKLDIKPDVTRGSIVQCRFREAAAVPVHHSN